MDRRNWGGVIRHVVDELIAWPVMTMPFVAERFGVSAPTAKDAVDRLVDIGVLKEITGRKYRRVFGATDVIDIIPRL